MPTYQYQCTECGAEFEVFHGMSATPPRTCREVREMTGSAAPAPPGDCEGPVERLLTGGTGLIFKGSGFYITDYKNNGSAEKAKAGATKTESVDTEKKKSETKPVESAKSKKPKVSDASKAA